MFLIYIKCWVPFQKVWRLLNIFMPDYTWIENWLLLGLSSDEIVHERWLVQRRDIVKSSMFWPLQNNELCIKDSYEVFSWPNNWTKTTKFKSSHTQRAKTFASFLKNINFKSNHFWNSVFFLNRGFEKCKTEIFRIGGNFVLICSLHVMFKTDECRVWLSQRFLPLQSPPFKSKQQQSVGKRGQYQTLTCIPNDPWQILPMG